MVLKELIFNSFFFQRVCGGLEKKSFLTVSTSEGVVVLKELNFNSVHFWRMLWFLKELIFNSFSFGRVWCS